MSKIRSKDRDAVIQSLRAGVVPRTGQHLIQVGRIREVETLVRDIDRVADGGSGFRMVIGEYGSGKTFFLNLIRSVAMERKLVVVSADLNPDRRLHAGGGQARSLYAELMRNMATRARPDGGALSGVVEKFIATAKSESQATGHSTEQIVRGRLEQLTELVNGYAFADVIAAYCGAVEQGNEQRKSDAVRWLRGEFATKTDARAALGVREIVDDSAVYDQLKLMARFVRLAGYSGLMVCLDEMVNLFKLSNSQARNANYEQLLRMLNDSLQGVAVGLGFVFGGTPDFLFNTKRGVYSYEALQGRLSQNTFTKDGLVDFSGPVVQLSSLTIEDFYLLLDKIRHVYAGGNPDAYLLPDIAIERFMEHCSSRLGNDFFRTPRTTITSFINLLAVLEQNPETNWQRQLGHVDVSKDVGGDADHLLDPDDELASFTL